MNRTVRAAHLAAAGALLCAGLSFAAPSLAEGPGNAAGVAGEGQAQTGWLAAVYNKAMDALAGGGAEKASGAEPLPLDALVEANEAAEAGDREQDCLANAVYFESRGEPVEGQLAVAQVVLNRASSGRYPSDLCAVITQKAQFSYVHGGRMPIPNKGSEAWRKSVGVARIAREKLAHAIPGDVLWYHATYVSPGWGKRLNKEAQIGLHIFYS